ncbi:MAG: extracellular solute-binding protein [Treponema sp.]|jgi:putative aldouronate transport system substrate-binding protein|nr:extracellular solute-binding protein [Treponema sp.]
MKKTKATITLCGVIAASLALGGCAKKSGALSAAAASADEPGWKGNVDKPVQFDWYINFNWFSRQWGTSRVSKYITAKTGVDLRFIVPAGGEDERLNAMIAGDVLPDLLTLGFWAPQIPMMIEAGLLEPLNRLAEQYDPYFFKVASPEKLAWYTQADGNVYGYPNASYTSADYERYQGNLTANETFLVRKDIYEAIGKPDMTTPEGFLRALRLAKEKFPTVNGQPLIPLVFREFGGAGNDAFAGHLQHFLAMKPEKDGRYEDPLLGPDNPEYVRWLKTFRQAAQEGLVPMDVFVDHRPQIEEKAAQGRYFAMLYQNWDMQAPQGARYAADPNSIYIAVDGPRNSRGDPPTLAGGGISGWTLTLISKNCKDKARAIQFLTYLISEEGQMDTYFGVPENNGLGFEPTYTIKDGRPVLLPAIAGMDKNDKNRQEIEVGVQYTYWMLMDTPWTEQWPKDFSPALEQPQLWTRPYVTSFTVYDRLDMPSGSAEALIFDEILRRWGQDLPRLLLAKTEAEFDTLWADYQRFKKDRGYAQLQARQTELLNENKARLKAK